MCLQHDLIFFSEFESADEGNETNDVQIFDSIDDRDENSNQENINDEVTELKNKHRKISRRKASKCVWKTLTKTMN